MTRSIVLSGMHDLGMFGPPSVRVSDFLDSYKGHLGIPVSGIQDQAYLITESNVVGRATTHKTPPHFYTTRDEPGIHVIVHNKQMAMVAVLYFQKCPEALRALETFAKADPDVIAVSVRYAFTAENHIPKLQQSLRRYLRNYGILAMENQMRQNDTISDIVYISGDNKHIGGFYTAVEDGVNYQAGVVEITGVDTAITFLKKLPMTLQQAVK